MAPNGLTKIRIYYLKNDMLNARKDRNDSVKKNNNTKSIRNTCLRTIG